ncbi:MAG: ATP-binding cassette domain-containing protein [Pseudomonadales bacterium]|jgi:peptide/nickel transport system ATP-binding protein|nr:ATP-binding cassette domain-containing protein [Pseudomonadales bacterium]MDP4641189.1 ATP-binding cassette domain-containing protein [Pseudomonadales bacterium]MDP4875282.1 ATP-binding cassette domain-containing protein [Pseudomonadales bacterium]MDP4912169.1 ATP-binding cassette domain-containing protein [Pseudomonadales bacterium]MDP5058635.1 ATP-binding cassette domain-containing protein [Pseudomonadales bacterium]
MSDELLRVNQLNVRFPVMSRGLLRRQTSDFHAVKDLSFHLNRGETLGIVGESGSGKTSLVRALIRAIKPSSGSAVFNSSQGQVDLCQLSDKQLVPLRTQMQMIFQDPFASLNPRMKVGEIIAEPLAIHAPASRAEHRGRVIEMLGRVGLEASAIQRFPHAFSGGQRQRIGIARALIMQPALVVCDEAVSALDVSVQAQVLNLLADLQAELGLTYIFVSHDLNVVRHFCERALVMYRGEVVEEGAVDDLFDRPQHNYTRLLLSAIPSIDPDVRLAPLSRASLGLPIE